jgi:hypothetical protein
MRKTLQAKLSKNLNRSQMFWRRKFNIEEFIKKYEQEYNNPLLLAKLMDTFPGGTRSYKQELLKLADTIIRTEDAHKLELFISLAWRDGIDESYKPFLKQVILARWHTYHEDIVDFIYGLKDDDFTNDVYSIASDSFYRQFDDENDATLRKCIHALKAINSENANAKLKLLIETGNINIKYALEMYR